MLKTEREKKVHEIYAAQDEHGKVHCDECPLNLVAETGEELSCRATHHYNEATHKWEPDEDDVFSSLYQDREE